jgi:hypothetical protein
LGYLCIFSKKLPDVNNCSIGEKSPNPVTLIPFRFSHAYESRGKILSLLKASRIILAEGKLGFLPQTFVSLSKYIHFRRMMSEKFRRGGGGEQQILFLNSGVERRVARFF